LALETRGLLLHCSQDIHFPVLCTWGNEREKAFDLMYQNILAKLPQITSFWSLCSEIATFFGKVDGLNGDCVSSVFTLVSSVYNVATL
jgi:hypothetical protein